METFILILLLVWVEYNLTKRVFLAWTRANDREHEDAFWAVAGGMGSLFILIYIISLVVIHVKIV